VVHTTVAERIRMIEKPTTGALTSSRYEVSARIINKRPTNPKVLWMLIQTSLHQIMGIPHCSSPSNLLSRIIVCAATKTHPQTTMKVDPAAIKGCPFAS
tara:strand:+ start:76 stop:372 length:297 start_codon:yes stop_codon:yes gene_type:complete